MNISTLYHLMACNVNAWRTGKAAYWHKCKPGFDKMYAAKQEYQVSRLNYKDGEPLKVIHMVTDSPCITGLSDQLRATLSLYQSCMNTGVTFKLFWDYPFALNEFLLPNKYDWFIAQEDIDYHHPTEYRAVHCEKGIALQRYFDKRLFNRLIRQASGGHQLHLYSNSWFKASHFAEVFDKLFKPSPILAKELIRHRAMLGDKYISVSLRFMELLGDFEDSGLTKPLPTDEREELIKRCLSQITKIINQYPSDYKVFVASDSRAFLDRVTQVPRVYTVPGEIVHLQFKSSAEVYLKTFVDLLLLRGAKKRYLLLTGEMYNSGFPKFASQIGNGKFKLIRF